MDKDPLAAAITCTHCTGEGIQGGFKVSDDSRLGRCCQGYQAVQGRRSCVCALPWTSPRDKHPRCVPAIVKKSLGTRCFNVKVVPHGPVWRRHWEQLQPRYVTDEDNEPGDVLWTTFLSCRRIIPWRYRGLYHRLRDIPGPRLYHPSQSTDRTIPDDRKKTPKPNQSYCC